METTGKEIRRKNSNTRKDSGTIDNVQVAGVKEKEAGVTKYIAGQKRKHKVKGGEVMVLTSFMMPSKLKQEIAQIATDWDITKSEFIRMALTNEVERWQA